ncbi:diguanylate cyclase [Qipengyuania marisflavi]|uniref:diguanylate cyclase n=1 Tax=Qipengyuania marisflavi TaxID=2486356 RepID=A0A5S3P8I9_9SPHN|nr:diguanylate cyclase [Qipengyuania marisflavi]TMM49736.1 diguanylate cyclase [Qipengyuania marisflavi]
MWIVDQVARRSRHSDWRGYFLIACIAALALMLAGASFSAWRSAQERRAAEERQVRTLEVLIQTDKLRASLLDQMRGERGYLLTSEDAFLEPYVAGRANAAHSYTSLDQLTAKDPSQQERLGRLQQDIAMLETTLARMIEFERRGDHTSAVSMVRSGKDRGAIERILSEIDKIEAHERTLLARRTATSRRWASANEAYQYVLAAVGLLLLALALGATIFVRRAVGAEAAARRELQRIATTDVLTELPNRRAFMIELERSITRAESKGRSLSLAIFDIDHFKKINDHFGHPAGDQVIRAVAQRASDALRNRDLVGRVGGEEFAVILPSADLAVARTVCERVRWAIAENPLRFGDAIIPFTASIGIAELAEGDDLDRLMARADAALYAAKNGGRNQVQLAA